MWRKEVTWNGYLKGKTKFKNDKIVSVKVFTFNEKNKIFEPNKICLIVSNLQIKLKFLLNLLRSISEINNLLFSVLCKGCTTWTWDWEVKTKATDWALEILVLLFEFVFELFWLKLKL